MVCEAFGIDPLAAIAEGSLLITAKPKDSQNIVNALRAGGIAASVIGIVTSDPETRTIQPARRDNRPF